MKIFGFENIKNWLQHVKPNRAKGGRNSIAKLNRHTGTPHEHARERARRRRQAAR